MLCHCKQLIFNTFNTNIIRIMHVSVYVYRRLSVCEKALAEYLETKRLTFPRFYFVSASDLLEIVSKGTQPREVAVILIHCIGTK